MATGIVGAAVTVLGIMAGADHDQVGLRRQALGRRDHRRRHARHPDPPSVMLIVMGPVLGRIGRRTLRGRVRSRLPAGRHLCRLPDDRSFINPKLGPPVPMEERSTSMAMLREVDRRGALLGL
jgi:hypothetical protein